MEALERQIGEHDDTVRAPANWIATAQRQQPVAARRVTVRECFELAIALAVSAMLAWVI